MGAASRRISYGARRAIGVSSGARALVSGDLLTSGPAEVSYVRSRLRVGRSADIACRCILKRLAGLWDCGIESIFSSVVLQPSLNYFDGSRSSRECAWSLLSESTVMAMAQYVVLGLRVKRESFAVSS